MHWASWHCGGREAVSEKSRDARESHRPLESSAPAVAGSSSAITLPAGDVITGGASRFE